jgi:hypothetical protein
MTGRATGGPTSRREPGDPGEAGSALVAALLLALTASVAAAGLAASARGVAEHSARMRDRAVALAAAEAGVEEARALLAADPDLVARLAEDGVAEGPSSPDWIALGDSGAALRYEVEVLGHDRVRVRADGRAGPGRDRAARRVEVHLRARTLADLHRFTDLEVLDPTVTPGSTEVDCARYRYDVTPRAAGCREVVIGPTETVAGDLHTNDVLRIAGTPRFLGRVTTAWVGPADEPDGARWQAGDATADPTFLLAPTTRPPIDLAGPLPPLPPGTCRYRGPTLIRLLGDRMRVWSPLSVAPGEEAPAASCGGPGGGDLTGRTEVPLPASGVVHVTASGSACTVHPLGLSSAEDDAGGYGCASGDVFVWGTYDGVLTIVADGDAYLLWDVVAAERGPTSDDSLGIVAGRSVVLRRLVSAPVRPSAPYGRNLPSAGPSIAPFGSHPLDSPVATATIWQAPRIDAHLVARGRSVRIQNPFRGQQHTGVLELRGSVAQRYRGPLLGEILSSTGSVLARTGYPADLAPRTVVPAVRPPWFPAVPSLGWAVLAWSSGAGGAQADVPVPGP